MFLMCKWVLYTNVTRPYDMHIEKWNRERNEGIKSKWYQINLTISYYNKPRRVNPVDIMLVVNYRQIYFF